MQIMNWSAIEESTPFAKLPAGAYVVRIVEVEDIPSKQYLNVVYDIKEGPFAGFYSHSIRRESLLAYLVVSRPQKTDATALGGTPRHQTGTALLSSMKLKFNSVVLSFIFCPSCRLRSEKG